MQNSTWWDQKNAPRNMNKFWLVVHRLLEQLTPSWIWKISRYTEECHQHAIICHLSSFCQSHTERTCKYDLKEVHTNLHFCYPLSLVTFLPIPHRQNVFIGFIDSHKKLTVVLYRGNICHLKYFLKWLTLERSLILYVQQIRWKNDYLDKYAT